MARAPTCKAALATLGTDGNGLMCVSPRAYDIVRGMRLACLSRRKPHRPISRSSRPIREERIVAETLALQQEMLTLIEARRDAGRASDLALKQLRLAVASSEADLAAVANRPSWSQSWV